MNTSSVNKSDYKTHELLATDESSSFMQIIDCLEEPFDLFVVSVCENFTSLSLTEETRTSSSFSSSSSSRLEVFNIGLELELAIGMLDSKLAHA